jgi:tetratricopeptide (TPR) repeat protein
MTSEAIQSSLTYFTEAITIDPGFAPAYAGLADRYAQMGSVRVKPKDALAKARPLLQRAMEIDNTMAEAHCTLGLPQELVRPALGRSGARFRGSAQSGQQSRRRGSLRAAF